MDGESRIRTATLTAVALTCTPGNCAEIELVTPVVFSAIAANASSKAPYVVDPPGCCTRADDDSDVTSDDTTTAP